MEPTATGGTQQSQEQQIKISTGGFNAFASDEFHNFMRVIATYFAQLKFLLAVKTLAYFKYDVIFSLFASWQNILNCKHVCAPIY
jgi:hypothetical protein